MIFLLSFHIVVILHILLYLIFVHISRVWFLGLCPLVSCLSFVVCLLLLVVVAVAASKGIVVAAL